MVGERIRKVRSDKKIEVKPTVGLDIFECVSRISYITNTPLKDVAETIVSSGFYNAKVLQALSEKLHRDFWHQNTLYKGDSSRPIERTLKIVGPKKRLTLRFERAIYDKLNTLAYCLNMTVSSTVALLLQLSLKNSEIVDHYISGFVTKDLDSNRVGQLKEVVRFINANNPYDNEVSFSMIVNLLFDEVREGAKNAKSVVSSWLNKFL